MSSQFPEARPRRLRRNASLRCLFQETEFTLNDLVLPIFVEEEIDEFVPIKSMRGVVRIPESKLAGELERYARAGADGIFIEAPESVEEMQKVGEALKGIPLMANMLEGGRTPILRPPVLEELGFRIVIYGITLLMRAAKTMQLALEDIKSGELKLMGTGVGFEEYKRIVGFPQWAALENRYLGKKKTR